MQPQPFLRWAGGKRKLAAFIANSFPTKIDYSSAHYYEPFLGGGALAFYIGHKESPFYIPGSRIHLSDTNPDLISAYQVLRDDPLTRESPCISTHCKDRDCSSIHLPKQNLFQWFVES